MIITNESHLDHSGLTINHLRYVLEKFGDRDGFFIEEIEFPEEYAELGCDLHGPIMGDAPITDDETVGERVRDSGGVARIVPRPPRPTRKAVVIAGPRKSHDCVLFTIFGGPLAPRQPGDESLESEDDIAESVDFWKDHAQSLAY